MGFPVVGKQQEERIYLAINGKAKILGRRKKLVFFSSIFIKQKKEAEIRNSDRSWK
jgi:hypothetical protein